MSFMSAWKLVRADNQREASVTTQDLLTWHSSPGCKNNSPVSYSEEAILMEGRK